jgi:hypothetical protein
MTLRCSLGAVVLPLFLVGAAAQAKNVDLSTVPARDGVQLTIYNSEDLTLVRETRKVSFKQGPNALQFSWANTLIDPTSVELRFLTEADELDVLDTTFPQDKPQMLYWNVQSEIDGEATVEITYFTSGITWAADYVGTLDPEETEMRFEGFVRVSNNSGEEYEDARLRLVVGRVNLVEKIAELARISPAEVSQLSRELGKKLKGQALKKAITLGDQLFAYGGVAAESSARGARPKEIIKEGLSEYFIYTIEGTETIPNGWSKRMRSFEGTTVPLEIEYRYREPEYGPRLVRMVLLTNDEESNLGTTPLPDGTVRLFRRNGRDGLSYLVAQPIKYVPIGDKIEINLGPDPEVVFELVKLYVWRDDLWMKVHGADVFRRVDEPGVEIEVNSTVAGWNEHTLFAQRVRSYSNKPVDLEVRRTFEGHVVFRSGLAAVKHDYRTVQYTAAVPAGEKTDLVYEIVEHQGRNKKQDNVTIERGVVQRRPALRPPREQGES